MITRSQLYNYTKNTPAGVVVNYRDGSNLDLQKIILKNIETGAKEVKPFAHLFRGANDFKTVQNIWEYLRANHPYKIDGETQKCKLPTAFLRENGDCKSYSIFIGSLLAALNIPQSVEFTDYDNNPQPSHVYNRFYANGSWYPVDGTYSKFAVEIQPTLHLRYNLLQQVAGINYKNNMNIHNIGFEYMGVMPRTTDPDNDATAETDGKTAEAAAAPNTDSPKKYTGLKIAVGLFFAYKILK